MKDSMFWRLVAAMAVAGVFYVGHGLHTGGDSQPSLDFVSTAHAEGAGIVLNAADNSVTMSTCSPDGKTLYVFSRRQGNLRPVYLGSATADD
jgi:hypothetical protein